MEHSTITLIILGFAVVMFVWEKIPLALTAVIVSVALTLTGVLTPAMAFAGYVNSVVILFVAMFVIGHAFFETGMAKKVGSMVTKFAKTERQVIVSTMLVSGLLSSVLSNTGTAAVLIPVTIGIADHAGFSRARLLMPMAFASTLGGNLTLVGTPPNMIAQGALELVDMRFGFFEFAYVGIPLFVVGILYFVLLGPKLFPKGSGPQKAAADATKEDDDKAVDAPKWKQVFAVTVLLGTIAAMAMENAIGIPLHVSACIGAILLVASRVLTESQAYKAIDLRVVFLFGGVLPLATALEVSGAGSMIAHNAINLFGENVTPFLMMLQIYFVTVVLTNFISNTAAAALLAPLAIQIAMAMGADPRAAVMSVVLGASMAFATPIGSPPNTMVLTAGGYKFVDYVRAGLPFIAVGSVVVLLLLPVFFPFFP
ncbi:MAG: SLC13 family permease [Spirochaetes bacterium]|nr:SLC13 family permease [Spirochaetota bacterium]